MNTRLLIGAIAAEVLLLFHVATPAQGQPAAVLLAPDYGSPTYLDIRDEANRKGAGYQSEMAQVVRWRLSLVNWEALVAAAHAAENGDKQLNPPLELTPFNDVRCVLSSIGTFSQVRPGHFMFHFRCDGGDSNEINMLNFDPNRRVFAGQADIQGMSFQFASLSEGHTVAMQVKFAPVTVVPD
jgi:hypothetical protein